MNFNFNPLFWMFGIAGAIFGLVSAGLLLIAFRLVQDHWR